MKKVHLNMKVLIPIILLLSTQVSFGQTDTIYLDNKFNEVSAVEDASYYEVQSADEADTNRIKILIYSKGGSMVKERNYVIFPELRPDGIQKIWFESGAIKSSIEFKLGELDGNVVTYWHNGKEKRRDHFRKGRFVDGMCYDSSGNRVTHFDYEVEAKFPKGEKALMNFLDKEVNRLGEIPVAMEGRVDVSFIVNEDGSLTNIKIIAGLGDRFDLQAIKIVEGMPKWEPGQQDGEAVSSLFSLPINFMNE